MRDFLKLTPEQRFHAATQDGILAELVPSDIRGLLNEIEQLKGAIDNKKSDATIQMERAILEATYQMACSSMDPIKFENLEKVIQQICMNRNLGEFEFFPRNHTKSEFQPDPDPNTVIKLEGMDYRDDGGLFSIHARSHITNEQFIEAVKADKDIIETFILHGYSRGLGGIEVLDTDKINDDICRGYLIKKTPEELKELDYEPDDIVYDLTDQHLGSTDAIRITGVAFEPS